MLCRLLRCRLELHFLAESGRQLRQHELEDLENIRARGHGHGNLDGLHRLFLGASEALQHFRGNAARDRGTATISLLKFGLMVRVELREG